MPSLDLSAEAKGPCLDVDMTHSHVIGVPVEADLDFSTVLGPDRVGPEGEPMTGLSSWSRQE